MTPLKIYPATDSTKSAPLLKSLSRTTVLTGTVLAIALSGCKFLPGKTDDASVAAKVQATLAADSAVAGQPVTVAVQGGVVTLGGNVANDAQRVLASRDAAGVDGVKKVIESISVGSQTAAMEPLPMPPAPAVAPPPPAPAPAPAPAQKPTTQVQPQKPAHQPAPIERPQQAYYPPPSQPAPQPAPAPAPPPAPVVPPAPTYKTVTISSGETIPVRVTQTLDSATTQQGTTFSGVVAADVMVDGVVAIPSGSNISGRVDAVQEAAHFKGASLLTVSLTNITRRGEQLAVTTDPYSVSGKGRGANTAEKAGGGAAVGAILGGIFGGGKGAAIGAVAGGGLGAGSQAVTRGQEVQIQSESVVRFHLAVPITLKVRTDAGDKRSDEQGLEKRSNQ